jgi:SAM-dependent methyltransferase
VSGQANPYDAWADLMSLWEPYADDIDVAYYVRAAAELGGPSVELGIGYARVAEHVKPAYGVDSSPVMIARAQPRVPETVLIESDLAEYALPGTVRLAYAPLNTFDSVPGDDAMRAALRRTWEQTEPGGRLVFDGMIPDLPRSLRDNRRVELSIIDATIAIQTAETVVDRATGELEMTAIVDELDPDGRVTGRRYFPPHRIRPRSPEQWEALLLETGWEPLERWGGFDGEPLDPDGLQQVWVAERRES